MKTRFAFIKKELLAQMRSGKVWILLALFLAFGIMNPAIAKLTPWLLDILADSLAENGMTVTEVTVSAMDSWLQFFKNMPIALIALVLLEASILTKEYSEGTLILSLTKGLARYKVIVAKACVLLMLFSVGYWLCFSVTYAYNDFFWDNSVAKNLMLSAVCWWLFGVCVLSFMTVFSTLCTTSSGVLIGTGATVLASYLLGLLPRIRSLLPTCLTDGNSLIYGIKDASDYTAAIRIGAAMSIACLAVSIPIFNKKRL